MRKHFLLSCLVLFSLSASSQQAKEFYNRGGEKTDSMYSLYYRFKSHPTQSKLPYIAKTFYTSTNRLRTSYVIKEAAFNGRYTIWFENEKRKETGIYKNNQKSGKIETWYETGQPHEVNEYGEPLSENEYNHNLISYWDSLGNTLIINGFGSCNCYRETTMGEVFLENGDVVDGKKTGEWLVYKDGVEILKENYLKGKFLYGIRYQSGQEIRYNEYEVEPEFNGGTEALMSYIKKGLKKYPKVGSEKDIEDTVFVQFTVNQDGSIDNVEVIKGIWESLDEIAKRVVADMPRWNPGYYRGGAVRARYVLPINFRQETKYGFFFVNFFRFK